MASAKYHNDVARNSIAMATAQAVNAALGLSLNQVLGSAGVAIGTDKSKVSSAAQVAYTSNGVFASKAATPNLWTLTGPSVPPNSTATFLLFLDGAGVASTQMVDTSPGISPWAGVLQGAVDGKAVIGSVTVTTNATTTFIPGTTLLDAAGVTAVFTNGLPSDAVPYISGPDGQVYGARY